MAAKTFEEKHLRRERWCWYMYDFGNSAYAAVILLAVYSAYFQGQVVGGVQGSKLWGTSVGIAMLVVALISPFLGTIADFTASKKRFLFFFTALACVCTGLLFFVEKGDVFLGMLFFILAEIGYRSAQVFYDALLPEIASDEEMSRVSGNGWALGSAGGVLCLLIILPLIMIFKGTLMVRISFVITAVYYALSAIPIFMGLEEHNPPQSLPAGETYMSLSVKRLSRTVRSAWTFRQFVKFVASFLAYDGGVIMALNFASIIGAVLFGLQQQGLIFFVILVQVANVAGAYLFGKIANRYGGRRALTMSLVLLLVSILAMFVARTQLIFFVIGALAGFAMAGVQSLSRTMAGMLSPAGQSAEFYGFFAVAGRMSSFIGPAMYGRVVFWAASWGQTQGYALEQAEQFGHRVGLLSIGVFLVVGLLLLAQVNEKQARQAKLRVDNKGLVQAG
ncbi:MAG: MFS transporter [Anaerolineae bacterium]|nr:MFS transporter [Anaerolineae bacterium]